jgi:hypothetical protein
LLSVAPPSSFLVDVLHDLLRLVNGLRKALRAMMKHAIRNAMIDLVIDAAIIFLVKGQAIGRNRMVTNTLTVSLWPHCRQANCDPVFGRLITPLNLHFCRMVGSLATVTEPKQGIGRKIFDFNGGYVEGFWS